MKRLGKILISGAILAVPLFTSGCYYETYPHYRHSYSYDDDDGYYRRHTSYNYRVGAVWVPGHWRRGVWIRGHWE